MCTPLQAVINILAIESLGSFGGLSNKDLSAKEPTFLTPDAKTFSVWAIVYLFQAAFCIYQIIPCFQNSHAGVSRSRFWVVVLFLCGSLWRPVFAYELHWLALMLILIMDISLIMIYRSMEINYGAVDPTQHADMMLPSVMLEEPEDTRARIGAAIGASKLEEHSVKKLIPWPVKVICFTGFSTNISWLAVVSMVNVCTAFGSNGWQQVYTMTVESSVNATNQITITYVNGSEEFAIMAVCLVAVIACVLCIRHCDVPYALIAVWALGGVQRAQTSSPALGFPEAAKSTSIADWATSMMLIVGVFILIGLVKAIMETMMAYRSRASVSKAQKENDNPISPRFDDIINENVQSSDE